MKVAAPDGVPNGWKVLERARSPTGLLTVKIGEMERLGLCRDLEAPQPT